MKKQSKSNNQVQGGPLSMNSFAKSQNAMTDLLNSYNQFDSIDQQIQPPRPQQQQQRQNPQQQQQQQQTVRPPRQQQQSQQFGQQSLVQRNSSNQKNSNERRSNSNNRKKSQEKKSNSSQKQPQVQQQQQINQKQQSKNISLTLTQGVYKSPKNIIHYQPNQFNEDKVIKFIQSFKRNIQLTSFFEEFFKNNQIKQHSLYFTSLQKAVPIQTKNGFIVLDFTQNKVIKQKSQSAPGNNLFTENNPIQFDGSWLRTENETVFQQVAPEYIIQGQLGDCFLISSISVLADFPQVLKRLVESNGNGMYTVWICADGRWRPITLDNQFPSRNGRFIYALPYENDIGSMLIEKAYAKQYGRSYQRIQLGFSMDALKDLTGAPVEYLNLLTDVNPFGSILDSLEKGFVLTASSKDNDDGLVSKHCYGVLQVKELTLPQNKKYKLVKLRNPYGNYNQGQKIPEFLENKLGEPFVQGKGVFWMLFEDFKKDFEVVTVCKLYPTYIYSYIKFKQENFIFGEQCGLVCLRTARKTHVYIGLHQKHTRYYWIKPEDKLLYQYQVGRIILVKMSDNQNGDMQIEQVINGAFSCYQSTFLEAYLEIGTYLIYSQVDRNLIGTSVNGKKIGSYVVSCYSENPIAMEQLDNVSTQESKNIMISDSLLLEIMNSYIVNNCSKNAELWNKFLQKSNEGYIYRYHGTGFGHVFIYHQNQCAQDKYIETHQYTSMKNLYFYRDFNDQVKQFSEAWRIEMNPQTISLILFKIQNIDQCSHKIVFISKSQFESDIPWAELKQQAIKAGGGKKRSRNGKEIQVFYFQYKYNGGVMLVYQNLTNQQYQENVKFTTLENCWPYDQYDQAYDQTTIKVVVDQQQTFGIKLKLRADLGPAKFVTSYTN